MLADRREFECVIIDVALGGIALKAPVNGDIGEPIIVYIDQLGRVQGDIVRYVEGGFAVKLTVTTRATERLAIRLSDLQASGNSDSPPEERRRSLRVEPDDKVTRITLPLGIGADCEVLDLSRTGADVKTSQRPQIGCLVQLGQLLGKVVRHTEHGVAIAFEDMSDSASLSDRFAEIVLPKQPLD